MVPVLVQQPVACAVIRTVVVLGAPVRGMLVLPAMVAVSWVGPVIGIWGHFWALPPRFSGPLAGLVGTETLRLDPGMRQHETSAMGTAHGAVHGFRLREVGHRKKRRSQEE